MAVQSDWQKYQAAFREWRATGGPMPEAVRDMRRAQGEARDRELRAKGYGPARFDLKKQQDELAKQLQREANKRVADAAPKHARLIADVPSTCLESLTWKDGIATATFYRGGQVTYEYPMSKDDFVDWISSGSLGKYGNENVF